MTDREQSLQNKILFQKELIKLKTKAIKDLEKENKTMRSEIGIAKGYIERIEKENAELKAFKEKCKFNVSDMFKDIETENNLTKAKEIINEFLSYYHSNNYPYQMLEILGKAEQFLNSEVEK